MRFNRIFLSILLALLLPLSACQQALATPAATKSKEEGAFLDTLCFLGDSTTAHMESRAPLNKNTCKSQLWCAKERYLNLDHKITYAKIVCPQNGQEMTIGEVAALVRPPYLVVTLGIDYGVYYYRNELQKFRHYYEKLLDTVKENSPDTTLILQSIFPVGRESSAITNEMVDNANAVILEISRARGLFYADTNALLKDAEGYLAPPYVDSADGIHLTSEAYRVILEYFKASETKIKETKK